MSRAILVLMLVVLVVAESHTICASRLKDDKHRHGGLSDERPADAADPTLSKAISIVVEEMKLKDPSISDIRPLTYRSQFVAGVFYLVKAVIEYENRGMNDKYVHLAIRYTAWNKDKPVASMKMRTDVDENTPLERFR